MNIVFNKPYISNDAKKYCFSAISESQLAGNKKYSTQVQNWICKKFKVKYALFTTSCTHALELAVMALGLKEDDEVILPSFTFVSTANALIRNGVKPVFVDVKEKDLNIDVDKIEGYITQKTKAIIPVHYAGISCDMDELKVIAKRHGLFIIEDAAQAFDAMYKNKYVGTIGDIGCYSFHETKNLTCGEGGAFLTNNEEIFQRAEIIREKGTNRSKYLRGEINKYSWVSLGSSFVQSDILAALLLSQFVIKDEIKSVRKKIFNYYMENLRDLKEEGLIKLPLITDDKKSNYHIFYVLVKNGTIRGRCLQELRARGINAAFHYIPLHSSPYGKKILQDRYENLKVTEDISNRIIRLPIYPDLKKKELEYVIKSFKEIVRENIVH
ncbi:MAG: dTDP-4-amino-4,6-dideoxygalactose transaminase [Chitinispirillaceae bacterium]|jgi:dTDP-4-amino-4,6-dideoxygalactose transaminase